MNATPSSYLCSSSSCFLISQWACNIWLVGLISPGLGLIERGVNMSLQLLHKLSICMHDRNFIIHECFVSHLFKISFSEVHVPTSWDGARWFSTITSSFSQELLDFAPDISPSVRRVTF